MIGAERSELDRSYERCRELNKRYGTTYYWASLLLPPDAGLDAIPRLELEPSALDALARGQVVGLEKGVTPARDALVRVVDGEGRLAAMARVRGRRLFPDKVFVTPGA